MSALGQTSEHVVQNQFVHCLLLLPSFHITLSHVRPDVSSTAKTIDMKTTDPSAQEYIIFYIS